MKFWIKVLKKILHIPVLPVFKTITLGQYENAGEIRKKLEEHGFEITKEADFMLEDIHLKIQKKKKKIDLVCISVEDLGLKKVGKQYLKNIIKRAKLLGLGNCPIETGPLLCLELYPDKASPNPGQVVYGGETLTVASMPIPSPYSRYSSGMSIFHFSYDIKNPGQGPRYLTGNDSSFTFPGYDLFVFTRPRKQGQAD